MAYQDWFTRASRTANAVGSNLPPALIPTRNSVLNEQPVPQTYTTNMASGNVAHGQPKNTPISNVGQINQIMNSINPQAGAGNLWSNTSGGGGGGNAPSSWNAYSQSGMTNPAAPNMGPNNPGVTQNYNTGFFNPDVSGGNWSGVDEMNNFNSWINQQPWAQMSGTPISGGQDFWKTGFGQFLGGSAWGLGQNVGNAILPGLGTGVRALFDRRPEVSAVSEL